MPLDPRHRTSSRDSTGSSMISGSSHSSSSSNEGPMVGNRSRTDTGDSSNSSQGGESSTARRRRSHRPRGCRGGRKNRKKQQLQLEQQQQRQQQQDVKRDLDRSNRDQPAYSVAAAKTIGRGPKVAPCIQDKPQISQGKPNNRKSADTVAPAPVGDVVDMAPSQSTISASSSSSPDLTPLTDKPNLSSSSLSFSYSPSSSSSSSSTNNNNNNQRKQQSTISVPIQTQTMSHQSSSIIFVPRLNFISASSAPTTAMTNPSALATTSSEFIKSQQPKFLPLKHNFATAMTVVGTTIPPGEILPPPPPPTVSSGRRVVLEGPNPYSLTSANSETNSTAAVDKHKEHFGTTSMFSPENAQVISANNMMKTTTINQSHNNHHVRSNSTSSVNSASAAHSRSTSRSKNNNATMLLDQHHTSYFSATMDLGTHSDATTNAAKNGSSSSSGDSLFSISPRSFLMGNNKGHPVTSSSSASSSMGRW